MVKHYLIGEKEIGLTIGIIGATIAITNTEQNMRFIGVILQAIGLMYMTANS